MKKIILGMVLLASLVLASVSFASTGSFTALKASFKVLVNGVELKSDKPIVTIGGSTYLPLSDVSKALGIKVNFNTKKNQIEVGETNLGNNKAVSFKNPGNIGSAQILTLNDYDGIKKFSVNLTSVLRGDPALYYLKSDYDSTKYPENGYEYLVAKIDFKVLSLKKDTCYDVSGGSQFDLISQQGVEYEYSDVYPKEYLDGNVYEGAEKNGVVVYKIKTSDLKPRIAFGRNYDGTGGVWFKAYKDK